MVFPLSRTLGLAFSSAVAVAVAVLMAGTAPGLAQSRAEVVRGVLENYASVLRRNGLAGTDDAARLARTVVDDLDWVQPGDADASLLYNVLIAAPSPPLPRELEAVRDWIDALPEPKRQCEPPDGAAKVISHDAAMAAVANDLAAQPPGARSRLRYFSLAALMNRCALKPEEADAGVAVLLLRLAPKMPDAAAERLKDGAPLWRVSLDALQMTAAQWETLALADLTAVLPTMSATAQVAAATGSKRAIIRADALAFALSGSGERPPQQGPLNSLVAAYGASIDAAAAAAELGVSEGEMRRALFLHPRGRERQLLTRRISRARFVGWYPRLAALVLRAPVARAVDPRPAVLTGPAEAAEPAPALMLSAEYTALETGDLVTVSVTSDRACDLEVVDVDPGGNATLLFPNDFQRSGRLIANKRLDLPGLTAPFQFRLDRVGTETIVAHCFVPGSRRIRSELEFVRQRFLDLGSWRDTKAHTELPLRGAEARKPPKLAPKSAGSRLLSRAALRFTVR